MKIAAFFLCLFFIHSVFSFGQELKAFKKAADGCYNFWLHTPSGYDKERPTPLVVFLHGKSLCGGDMSRVCRYGPIHALKMGREINALVLAPHNNGVAWKPAKVMKTLEWVQHHFFVDTTRIYIIGISLGSYGTLDFVNTYPDKVAAAMALCGGCTMDNVASLGKLPLWLIHGTADRAVPIKHSERIVKALTQIGDTFRLIFTKLPGANHGHPARAFYLEDTYQWLFHHSLTDSLRSVCRKFEINNEKLRHAYQGLHRAK